MPYSTLKIMSIAFLAFIQIRCAHEKFEPTIAIKVNHSAISKQKFETFQQLEEYFNNQSLFSSSHEIYYIARGEFFSQNNNHRQASKEFAQAISLSPQSFIKELIKKWINETEKSLKAKQPPSILARLLHSELSHMPPNPALKKINLSDEDQITEFIEEIYGIKDAKKEATHPPPDFRGIPPEDKLLISTANQFCKNQITNNYLWEAWQNTLPVDIQDYWQALTYHCKNSVPTQTISLMSEALSNLDKRRHFLPYSIYLRQQLILLMRRNDQRIEASKEYVKLMDAWQSKLLSPELFSWNFDQFQLEYINDALWAARYRALVGDYKRAKIYTRIAEEIIRDTKIKHDKMTHGIRSKLINFEAEAYHIRSFRIAAEQQEYTHAAYLNTLALKIEGLSEEWKYRFKWYQSLFFLVDNKLEKSASIMEELLDEKTDSETRSRTLYWLSRIYERMGESTKKNSLLETLSNENPLSFYNIVGRSYLKQASSRSPLQSYLSLRQMVKRIEDKSSYKISSLYNSKNSQSWLKKTEALTELGLDPFSQSATAELQKIADKTKSNVKSPEIFIYLSRLHFVNKNFIQAIIQTSALSKRVENFWTDWPEQLLIYYPNAYRDFFEHFSKFYKIDSNIALAISRQESAFNSQALSPAGAIGLMQIILPTAKRLSKKQFPYSQLKDELLKPEFNIDLGIKYLKELHTRYKGKLPAIFAAYNAGEYAVDRWIKFRKQQDPLLWVELIPYGETKGYVQNVWRNLMIYRYLNNKLSAAGPPPGSYTTQTKISSRSFFD